MKRLGLTLLLLSLLSMPVMAKNIVVEALSDFSTDNPPATYTVKILEPIYLPNGKIESGSTLTGKITTKDAKRLKRDATFTFVPIYLTEPDGTVIKVKKNYTGKYSKGLDKGKIAKTVAISAGNLVVKGFSTGYTAIEGAVKNEEGNILKSSAVAVYENSPLSYAQKGNALELRAGQHFYINFELDDEE